jgi:hypothetical protein
LSLLFGFSQNTSLGDRVQYLAQIVPTNLVSAAIFEQSQCSLYPQFDFVGSAQLPAHHPPQVQLDQLRDCGPGLGCRLGSLFFCEKVSASLGGICQRRSSLSGRF